MQKPMGRRKLEMKLIQDKNNRHATFSKRRSGLNKKARRLSALCDVDIAVIVFSSHGNLYEFCSGSTDSVGDILLRYQRSCLQAEDRTAKQGSSKDMGSHNERTRFRTCKELLQAVERVAEEPNELPLTAMLELEEELNEALMDARSRKTQLTMKHLSTLHEKERKLAEETLEMKQQVMSAQQNNDDGGGGLNNLAANDGTDSPIRPLILPLF